MLIAWRQELPGRLWEGKECVLDALGALAAAKGAVLASPEAIIGALLGTPLHLVWRCTTSLTGHGSIRGTPLPSFWRSTIAHRCPQEQYAHSCIRRSDWQGWAAGALERKKAEFQAAALGALQKALAALSGDHLSQV